MGTYGNTTIEATGQAIFDDDCRIWELGTNPLGATTIRSAYVYVSNLSGGEFIRIGLYSNTGSFPTQAPNTLLGETDAIEGVTTGGAWYSADFQSPIAIAASTVYWFAVQVSGGGITVWRKSSTFVDRLIDRVWEDGLPDPWSGGANGFNVEYTSYVAEESLSGPGGSVAAALAVL